MRIRKKFIPILIVLFIFSIYFIGKGVHFVSSKLAIGYKAANLDVIKDPNLRDCISKNIGENGEFANAIDLVCSYQSIGNLDGIQYLTNLQTLDLQGNFIKNTVYLASLDNLVSLNLDSNYITSVDFNTMDNLTVLMLRSNRITSINDVKLNNEKIKTLYLSDNKLKGLLDVSNLTYLETIFLANNKDLTRVKVHDMSTIKGVDLSGTKILTTDNFTDGTNKLTDVSDQMKILAINGFTMTDSIKTLIDNNRSKLINLQIGSSGITDINFLTSNAADFTNLNILTIGGNNLGENVDLSAFPFTNNSKIDLRRSGIRTLTLGSYVNKIGELYLSETNIESFDARNYKQLYRLDLSNNPNLQLDNCIFTNDDPNDQNDQNSLKVLDLSYNDLSSVNLGNLLNNLPISLEHLYLVNTKISGNINFNYFSNLEELQVHNNMTTENANDLLSVIIPNNLKRLLVNKNPNFVQIITSGQGDPQLEKLYIVSTSVKHNENNAFDLAYYPNIKNLGMAATKFDTLVVPEAARNSLRELTLNDANSIPNFDYTIEYPRLAHLEINYTQLSKMNYAKYPNLALLTVGHSKTVNVITSSKGENNVRTLVDTYTPSGIEIPSYTIQDNMYKVDDDTYKIGEDNKAIVYLTSEDPIISGIPNDYEGVLKFTSYYSINATIVEGVDYEFDDIRGYIAVGEDDDDTILSNISLSNSDATKRIEEGYLIIKVGDTEKKYRIVDVMPTDIIDGEDEPTHHDSLDPTEEEPEQKDYSTTENPHTGPIISFIAIVLLIASGIVMKYYLDDKRRNSELIEKI